MDARERSGAAPSSIWLLQHVEIQSSRESWREETPYFREATEGINSPSRFENKDWLDTALS